MVPTVTVAPNFLRGSAELNKVRDLDCGPNLYFGEHFEALLFQLLVDPFDGRGLDYAAGGGAACGTTTPLSTSCSPWLGCGEGRFGRSFSASLMFWCRCRLLFYLLSFGRRPGRGRTPWRRLWGGPEMMASVKSWSSAKADKTTKYVYAAKAGWRDGFIYFLTSV